MSFFDTIINFLSSLFGKKTASSDATVDPQTYALKTDKQTFYNLIVRGESYDTIDSLWNEVMKNEQSGVYDYKLTGKLGWYHIKDGLLIGNGAREK